MVNGKQCFNNLLIDLLENMIAHNPDDIRFIRIRLRDKKNGFEIAFANIWSNKAKKVIDEMPITSDCIGIVAKIRANQIAKFYCGEVVVRDFIPNNATLGSELIIWLPKQIEKLCGEVSN
jgi:hypothetical protein